MTTSRSKNFADLWTSIQNNGFGEIAHGYLCVLVTSSKRHNSHSMLNCSNFTRRKWIVYSQKPMYSVKKLERFSDVPISVRFCRNNHVFTPSLRYSAYIWLSTQPSSCLLSVSSDFPYNVFSSQPSPLSPFSFPQSFPSSEVGPTA